jgi:hypothetical protein
VLFGDGYLPLVGPPWITAQRERLYKFTGYAAWRQYLVTAAHWREVMDNWYYEQGPNPAIYRGISDPRNADIDKHAGFVKLLKCWFATKLYAAVVPPGPWAVGANSFTWRFAYNPTSAAGGTASYNSTGNFLGSYTAYILSPPAQEHGTGACPWCNNPKKGMCSVTVKVKNRSSWTSATRLPVRFRPLNGGKVSLFKSHPRKGARYTPSTGGNLDQEYIFTTTPIPCSRTKRMPACVLP